MDNSSEQVTNFQLPFNMYQQQQLPPQPGYTAQAQPNGEGAPPEKQSRFSATAVQEPQHHPLVTQQQFPAIPTTCTPEHWFSLGNNRYVNVKVWKGKVYVGIRQFAWDTAGNQQKATRSGINLRTDEWNELFKQMQNVDSAVQATKPFAQQSTSSVNNYPPLPTMIQMPNQATFAQPLAVHHQPTSSSAANQH